MFRLSQAITEASSEPQVAELSREFSDELSGFSEFFAQNSYKKSRGLEAACLSFYKQHGRWPRTSDELDQSIVKTFGPITFTETQCDRLIVKLKTLDPAGEKGAFTFVVVPPQESP